MAQTEFHIINKDRHFNGEYLAVNGAMQGAFRVWMELEKKYLPSLPPGPFTKPGEYNHRLYKLFDEDALKDIWKIPRMKETEWNNRILMEIYMDKAYIAYADLHEVAEALRNCEFATDNMKGQAIWVPAEVKKELEMIRIKASKNIPLRSLAAAMIMAFISEHPEEIEKL